MARHSDRLGIMKSRLARQARLGRIGKFADDEDGAMFILAMFLFITLLIVSGLSVDLMRYELQRTRLQATMDRALLAAAHPDQENDRKDVVMDYFARSGLGNYIKKEDVKVTVASDGTMVTATANMNVGMPFLGAVGVDYMNAPASGGAAKINQLTEISLVVDVSGSMKDNATTGNSKIYELRKAATEFSNLLLCNPNDGSTSTDCTIDNFKTSISLVPYSTQVNVGQTLLTKFNRLDAQTDAYCATFLDDQFNQAGIKSDADPILDPDRIIRQAAKFYRYGGSYKNTNSDAYLSCHTDSWREVVPFEVSPTVMKTKIQALQAEGDTAIDIGVKWGAALLHQEAQPAITSLIGDGVVNSNFAGRPYNPATTSSSKFLVLMTDGQNTNHHYVYDGYRTGPSPFWLTMAPYKDSKGRDKEREIMSVYRASTDQYQWFYYRGSRSTPRTEWHDKPFGDDPNDCFGYPYDDVCATETGTSWWEEPRVAEPTRLSWQNFWKRDYVWGYVERFSWLGDPGRLISNSNNSDGDAANIGDIDERLRDQCTAAKNAGMTIYTIEMETSSSTDTSSLESCASVKGGKRLHYKVTKGDSSVNLSQVFSKIAADINKLRLIN